MRECLSQREWIMHAGYLKLTRAEERRAIERAQRDAAKNRKPRTGGRR